MLYRIRVNDLTEHRNPEQPTKTLLQAFKSLEEAAQNGWSVIVALAVINGLDYENQGDQYMAFYKEGHPDAGMGAYTVEVIDEYDNPQEL